MKVAKFIGTLIITIVALVVIVLFEYKCWPAGSSIAGIALGFSLPAIVITFQDLFDTADWKVSQRKLERGKIINKDTIVRISFAYLFRIKIGDKYLLVKNERNTGKFQPVGGVYKLKGNEKEQLKNLYHVMDDDKITIDHSSRSDYRLRMANQHLRDFVKRFDGKADRENVSDLSREFKEELTQTGILNWNQITYRVCGRHMTELSYGQHFRIYEVLLADIVEVILTPNQENDLKSLMQINSTLYRFATEEEIKSLGVDTKAGKLEECIADHSVKVLQETENRLMKLPHVGEKYTVDI